MAMRISASDFVSKLVKASFIQSVSFSCLEFCRFSGHYFVSQKNSIKWHGARKETELYKACVTMIHS